MYSVSCRQLFLPSITYFQRDILLPYIPTSLHSLVWRKKEIKRGNTYSTRGANANKGYVGTLGMIQQFDQLVQHDWYRRNAHTVLKWKQKFMFDIHIDNAKYIWKKELDDISLLILSSKCLLTTSGKKPNLMGLLKKLWTTHRRTHTEFTDYELSSIFLRILNHNLFTFSKLQSVSFPKFSNVLHHRTCLKHKKNPTLIFYQPEMLVTS